MAGVTTAGSRFGGVAENPFVASRFEPGAGRLGVIGVDVDALVARVGERGGCFQVRGGHGSGKTTLLRELGRRAERAGHRVVWLRRELGPLRAWVASVGWGPRRLRPVVLVDEWDELTPGDALFVRAWASLRRAALVVGAHRDLGFVTLAERQVDVELAHAVVERLVRGTGFEGPGRARLERLVEQHSGNLREVLFELYDDVERAHAAKRRGPLLESGSHGIKVEMTLPTVDLSQFGAGKVRAAIQAAVAHASAGALPTTEVLKHGAEAVLKSADEPSSTYFVSILELAYLVASADGFADEERSTLADLLERLTGEAMGHDALELHFKDLADGVEMLGRRERLRRAAEDFADPTRQHEALGFAAVVALADGVLAGPENAALAELGGHFGFSSDEIAKVVGGIVARVRAELGS